MKILVIGSGGREHALVWKIAQSKRVSKIYCAPGNAGIAELAECRDLPAGDLPRLAAFARSEEIDLTVVGPEQPLTQGIVDLFRQQGMRVFGADRQAAALEGSKAFAKDLMKKYAIPTAAYRSCADRREAQRAVEELGIPLVIKADGLAAGKGVIICRSEAETRDALERIIERREFGAAGDRVVVEEFLEGEEASILAFTDGRTVLPMASSQDHKTVFDGDGGPNTGGMGAYSPAPLVTPELFGRIMEEIMIPTVRAMDAEGKPYRGVLYAGIMVTASGPKVLEYNARFGDPETQPILMRMAGDLVPVMEACLDGTLNRHTLSWRPEAAVCVVMASAGYPGSYPTGKVISGLAEAGAMKDVVVFHAGTRREGERIVTAGGRVLGITALGRTVAQAIERTYEAVARINFEGAHFRRDIGRKALQRAT